MPHNEDFAYEAALKFFDSHLRLNLETMITMIIAHMILHVVVPMALLMATLIIRLIISSSVNLGVSNFCPMCSV